MDAEFKHDMKVRIGVTIGLVVVSLFLSVLMSKEGRTGKTVVIPITSYEMPSMGRLQVTNLGVESKEVVASNDGSVTLKVNIKSEFK